MNKTSPVVSKKSNKKRTADELLNDFVEEFEIDEFDEDTDEFDEDTEELDERNPLDLTECDVMKISMKRKTLFV